VALWFRCWLRWSRRPVVVSRPPRLRKSICIRSPRKDLGAPRRTKRPRRPPKAFRRLAALLGELQACSRAAKRNRIRQIAKVNRAAAEVRRSARRPLGVDGRVTATGDWRSAREIAGTQKTRFAFGRNGFRKWCQDSESNRGHEDFQSSALPTELSWRRKRGQDKGAGFSCVNGIFAEVGSG
jgi:hypothetical protein